MKYFIILVMTLTTVLSASVSAQEYNGVRNLRIEGEARLLVNPDEVNIKLGMQSRGETVAEARGKTDETIAALLKFASQFGIDDKDMQSDHIRIDPYFDHNSKKSTPAYYNVRKYMYIILRDIDKFEQFISGVLETGVNSIDYVKFRAANIEPQKDSLRVLAIRDAKAKAEQVASELGLVLGKALSVNEPHISSHTLSNDNYSEGYGFGASVGVHEEEPAKTLAPGQIVLTCGIRILYELED